MFPYFTMGRPFPPKNSPSHGASGPHLIHDPSSGLATIDMGRKVGVVSLFSGELGPHLTQCRLERGLPRTKRHLDHFDRLDTTDIGRKLEMCPLFGEARFLSINVAVAWAEVYHRIK